MTIICSDLHHPQSNLQPSLPMDKLRVCNLMIKNCVGVDSWSRVKREQPLNLSFEFGLNLESAGETDTIATTINYGTLCELITQFSENHAFKSLEGFAQAIITLLQETYQTLAPHLQITLTVEKPRALLHASCVGIRLTQPSLPHSQPDCIYIKDLSLSTILGLNPWEREEKQLILVHLTYTINSALAIQDKVSKQNNYRLVAECVQQYVESTKFKTLEALCYHVVMLCLQHLNLTKVTVRIDKPSAILFAQCSSIEITKDQAWLSQLQKRHTIESKKIQSNPPPPPSSSSLKSLENVSKRLLYDFSSLTVPSFGIPLAQGSDNHVVYLALGTNLGDRAKNINHALHLIQSFSTLADTSFLYETDAMYLEEQPPFLNAACKIHTRLEPTELLSRLKDIEEKMGRDLITGVRNGPRIIDLDILFYDDIEYKSPTLEIPHPRIAEREFVLRPLADIAPNYEHPKQFRSISKMLALHQHSYPSSCSSMPKVLSFSPNHLWKWQSRTFVMGILNVTPDSFSDGGDYVSIDCALEAAKHMVNEGVDIIDIGGQSTRPGAIEISPEEEVRRVLPVVQKLRQELPHVLLSIDTFWSSVAEACIQAGAHFINDVSGGTKDPNMFPMMAELQTPVCLMHYRDPPHQTYVYENLMEEVEKELFHQINLAIQAGIYRWHIIVDPGIGFAKSKQQNFNLLTHLNLFHQSPRPLHGFPLLVGPSRKRFLGDVIQEPNAKERGWATAAAVSACVAGGADIVRVHNVKPMRDVVLIADQIWRSKS